MTADQYELEVGYKGDTVERVAQYATVEGLLGYCHQENTFAWIYDDRLRFKYNREPDDEGSHFNLFGMDVLNARFRGWYVPAKKLVTLVDRERHVRASEQIPEHLYRALRRQFNPQHWRVL